MASSIRDGPSFRATCWGIGVPNRVLTQQEAELAGKLCEVIQDRLLAQAKQLVCSTGMHGILFTYYSDKTQTLILSTITPTLPAAQHNRHKQEQDIKNTPSNDASSTIW